MNRIEARERAMCLLYQCEIRGITPEEALIDYHASVEEGDEFYLPLGGEASFLESILQGAWEHREELDTRIQDNTKGWKLSRLSRVLVAILRLAVYEIFYREDIPKLVSVNEAIELAKAYEDGDAASFAHGILSGVLKEVE